MAGRKNNLKACFFQYMVMPWRKISIFHRFLVILVFFIVMPIVIITLYYNQIVTAQFEKSVSLQYENAVSNIDSLIRTRVVLVTELMNELQKDKEMMALVEQDASVSDRLLQKINGSSSIIQPYIFNLMVVGDNGFQSNANAPVFGNKKIVLQYDRLLEQVDLKQNNGTIQWMMNDTLKKLFLVDDSAHISLGDSIMVLSRIQGQTGESITIVLNLSPKIFKDIYIPNVYNNENFFIVGKDDFIMPIHNDAMMLKEITHSLPIADFGQKGNGIFKIDGQERVYNYQLSSVNNWYLLGTAEKSKVFRFTKAIFFVGVVTSFVLILFSGLFAFLISLSISVPIQNLIGVFKTVTNDQLVYEYEDPYKDEISEIFRKFRSMIARIKGLMENVVQAEVQQKNAEINQKKAEVDAFLMQIKPHFLYNTLDIIRWKAMELEDETHHNDEVSTMILHLSNSFAYSIRIKDQWATIQEELEHVASYLKILECTKNFAIHLDLDKSIQYLLQYKIPKLTFQPIIENAVIHGRKKGGMQMEMKLYAKREKDAVEIVIQDFGMGMTAEKVTKLNNYIHGVQHEDFGIGLKNIHQRLQYTFGEDFGLTIESEYNQYTKVILKTGVPNNVLGREEDQTYEI